MGKALILCLILSIVALFVLSGCSELGGEAFKILSKHSCRDAGTSTYCKDANVKVTVTKDISCKMSTTETPCEFCCSDGECLGEKDCTVLSSPGGGTSCSDSDGGEDYSTVGTVVDASGSFTDYCSSDGATVNEYLCVAGKAVLSPHGCTKLGDGYFCIDGRCMPAQCYDSKDNDDDGLVDRDDLGCTYVGAIDNDESVPPDLPECWDTKDNDKDGLIDLADPGCTSKADMDETDLGVPTVTECNDGVDNDRDGTVDKNDADCIVAPYDSEGEAPAGETPQCSDGLDNDHDGKTDYSASGWGDPDCLTPLDLSESGGGKFCTPSAEICDGVDNDCDGSIDESLTEYCGTTTTNVGVCNRGTKTCSAGAWSACTGEVAPKTEVCSNGKDDDCDGIVDSDCVQLRCPLGYECRAAAPICLVGSVVSSGACILKDTPTGTCYRCSSSFTK